MPKPASTRSAYKMLTCIYLCRTLLFFAPYADFYSKVTRQFRMYTYRIRGKRGPFKIILPASFCSFLTLPGMSGSPSSFSDYQYFYSFMDRNVHAHFYRQPISIDCQVLFIFFFSGRLCRNRCCTFLDFQNRFDKVCRIVFRFVHRPLADSFRRNLLQNGNASAFPDFSVSFKT